MKVSPILSIVALAAPLASASTTPQRKRVFKIYTPREIREFEDEETLDQDERMLKKTQEPTMSMTMAPTVIADIEGTESPTPAPQAITDAPVAATDAPVAATDAPVAATGAPTEIVGDSYCTYAPDETCYEDGWPKCCGKKDGKDCPEEQPPCEIETEEPTPSPIGATDAPVAGATDAPVAAPIAATEDMSMSMSMSMATEPPVVPTNPPVVPTNPPVVPTNPPIVTTPTPTASRGGSFTFPPSPQPVESGEAPENPFANVSEPAPGSGAMTLGTSIAAAAVAGAMMLL